MSSVSLVTLTNSAKLAIIKMLDQIKDEVLGVRLQLLTKGCSGLSWDMQVVREDSNTDDKVSINDKYSLFIDKKSTLFVLGTKLDYVETDLDSGFVFHNPKEKGRCGCGESFYI